MIYYLLKPNKPFTFEHLFHIYFQAEEDNQNDIEDLTALLNRMGSGKFWTYCVWALIYIRGQIALSVDPGFERYASRNE